MAVLKSRFVELTTDMERRTLLDNIYIKDPKGGYRSLTSLYIKVADRVGEPNVVRRITSVADFRAEMAKNNVFFNEFATTMVESDETMHEPILYVDKIGIPNTLETVSRNQTPIEVKVTRRTKKANGKETVADTNITATSTENKIPYGLKRTLPVRSLPLMSTTAAAVQGASKITKNVKYLYAQAENGNWEFYELDTLFYYDGKDKVQLRDALTQGFDLSDKIIFDKNGDPLSQIYTEQGFYFDHPVAQESINVEEMKKTTYSIEYDGEVVYTIEDIPQKYSMQRCVTKDEPVGESGKTEKVSYVRTKNYHANEQGEYLAISVNGSVYMIHKDEVLDKDGNPITFIDEKGELVADSIKLGEPVYFMQDGELKASDPVTYEQLMIRYETYKTYQPTTEKTPTDETYLRIEDCAANPELRGRYVKELESVQPICYTVVGDDDTDFDRYFVKQIGGDGKWVSVDKEYFEKNKAKNLFDVKTYKKVKRCDYNSSKCHIMQTTSGDAKVENCEIISKTLADELGETVADKQEHFSNFINDYKAGKYQVKDLYLNGQLVTLAPDQTRYSYTDEAEYRDYANDTARYRAYNDGVLFEKDGKVKGGPKFKTGKVLKKRCEKIGEFCTNTCKVFLIGGFVFPPLYPVFLAGLAVGGALALTVATGTILEGIIRNTANAIPRLSKKVSAKVDKYLAKKATDKVEYNRKKEEKAIKQELRDLYKNRSKLSDIQFNDAMARLKHRIDNFAQTGSTSSFKVVDGKIQVNGSDAALAIGYKKAINAVNKDIKGVEAAIKKCFKKDGKTIKPSQQERYDQLQKRLTELKSRRESITNQTLTSQGARADKRGDRLERVSEDLRLHRTIQDLPTVPLQVGEESTLDVNAVEVLKRCKWTAEKGLQPTLMDRIFHRKEVKAVQAAMPTIQSTLVGDFKVEKPLSEQVEVKQEKLDAGREILHERTKDLGAVQELVTETADGYKSAGEVEAAIAGAEQEISDDHELLDGKFSLEQIEENIQAVEGHTQYAEAETAMDNYVTTIEEIREEHAKLHANLERKKAIKQDITDEEIADIDEYIERTLNADMAGMENMEQLQATLMGVKAMNAEIEASLGEEKEADAEVSTEQPEVEQPVETEEQVEPVVIEEKDETVAPAVPEVKDGETETEESQPQKVTVKRKKKSSKTVVDENIQTDEDGLTV